MKNKLDEWQNDVIQLAIVEEARQLCKARSGDRTLDNLQHLIEQLDQRQLNV